MSAGGLSPFVQALLALEAEGRPLHLAVAARFGGATLPPPLLLERVSKRIARVAGRWPTLAELPASAPPLGRYRWREEGPLRPERHLYCAPPPLGGLIDEVMGLPLRTDRPRWEGWVCQERPESRFALFLKASWAVLAERELEELWRAFFDRPGGRRVRPVRRRPAGVFARAKGALACSAALLADLPGAAGGAVGLTALGGWGAATALWRRDGLVGARERKTVLLARPRAALEGCRRVAGVSLETFLLAALAGGLRVRALGRGERPAPLVAGLFAGVGERQRLGAVPPTALLSLPLEESHPLRRLYRVEEELRRRRWRERLSGSLAGLAGAAPGAFRGALLEGLAGGAITLPVAFVRAPADGAALEGWPLLELYPLPPLWPGQRVGVGFGLTSETICLALHGEREEGDLYLLARGFAASLEEQCNLLAPLQRGAVGRRRPLARPPVTLASGD